MVQHVHDVRPPHPFRIVQAGILETAPLQIRDAGLGVVLHGLLGPEDDGTRGAGLDACRLQTHRHPVGTHRALVGLVVLLGDARDVERAAGDAVAAADALLLVEVHDAVGVLNDGTRRRAGLQAARLCTVHAAVLADQPLQVARGVVLVLGEPHHRPGVAVQVGGVVVRAVGGAGHLRPERCFHDVGSEVVPLHAGRLARLAPDALGDIDELGDLAGTRFTHLGWRGGSGRQAFDIE